MSATASLGAWVAAALLVAAGVAKLRRPGPTRAALRTAGLPAGRVAVGLLGVAEVATGVAVLGVGGRLPAAALVVAYGAFAAFAWSQRADPAATCGCFGTDTAPLSRLHVLVDGLLAAGALTAAVLGPQPITAAVAGLPALGAVTLLVGVATAAGLLLLLLTELPRLADRLAAPHPTAEPTAATPLRPRTRRPDHGAPA